MKIRPNETVAVVEVNAARFLDLWRGSPSSHGEIAHGNADTWSSDSKFKDAREGFEDGEWNPVPLARVNCGVAHEYRRMIEYSCFGFRVGITPV